MQSRPVLYSRELPGGGFVAIDAQPRHEGHCARLWVERRADLTRRTGHVPPVIVECEANSLDAALAELQAIAADNVALAVALRRWQLRRSGPGGPDTTMRA